jgi:hypothetical protein
MAVSREKVQVYRVEGTDLEERIEVGQLVVRVPYASASEKQTIFERLRYVMCVIRC